MLKLGKSKVKRQKPNIQEFGFHILICSNLAVEDMLYDEKDIVRCYEKIESKFF
jgi:hypothetical protein